MSDDIYRILQRFDNVSEGLGPEQEKVKQLPALFKPKNTSPQLSGPYPGKNATRGYLVGEDSDSWHSITDPEELADAIEDARSMDYDMFDDTWSGVLDDTYEFWDNYHNAEDVAEGDIDPNRHPQTRDYGRGEENAMRQAVTARIMNQHPEWIMRYGVEALVQAIDDVTEGEDDWEEIGTSDVSAYVRYVKDRLDDRMGSREEMADRPAFSEGNVVPINRAGYNVLQDKEDYLEKRDTLYRLLAQAGIDTNTKQAAKDRLADLELAARNAGIVKESTTTEDVISTVKKKLGDYLSDLSKEIKSDPDLKDKLEKDIDQIGPAVKTLKTDDGHEIKIHGNEDDGFRISIKNREAKTKFDNLDEAVMACEMYCAKRRGAPAVNNTDYIEEA